MHPLQTNAHWNLLVPTPSTLRNSHILIYSLNTRSLLLHKNDIFFYYNLKYNSYVMFKGNIFQPIFVDYCFVFKPPQLHPTLLTHKFNRASTSTNGFFLKKNYTSKVTIIHRKM